MVVLVAPDKFKGSLRAGEVAAALRKGLAGVESMALPLADGGDGSVDAALAAGFRPVPVRVPEALGVAHDALIAVGDDTVVVEVANTCGLATLPAGVLPALDASSLGFGVAVRHALELRPSRLVLALGGSASTDGGMGLLAALGFSFLDPSGVELAPCGRSLPSIASVSGGVDVGSVEIVVASDVTNPLIGPGGAAAVYGPQKGATPDDVRYLDDGLANLASLLGGSATAPGAGSAGGIGYAALYLGGRVVSGASYFLDLLGFDEACANASLVVTGEGSIDDQTAQGKLLAVLAARAGTVPVVAVGGRNTLSASESRAIGFEKVYAVGDYTSRPTVDDPELTADILVQIGEEIATSVVSCR